MIDIAAEVIAVVAGLAGMVVVFALASRRGARRQAILDRAKAVLNGGELIAVLVESVTVAKVIELSLRKQGITVAPFPVTAAGFEAAMGTRPAALVAREDEIEARGLGELISHLRRPVVLLRRPFQPAPVCEPYAGANVTWLREPFDTVEFLGALSSAIQSESHTAAEQWRCSGCGRATPRIATW